MAHVASPITKATAMPMPNADWRSFDTPMNGQMPRNWEKTMLLASTAVNMIARYSSMASSVFCRQAVEQCDK